MEKSGWSKEAGYIWSLIGSAVGFANILSFSALCYKNGGGAFLIPYVVAHACVGLPMLLLEGLIGQRTRLPLVSALGEVAGRLGRLLGWFAVLTCATIAGFYTVLTGFSVAYAYFSATGELFTQESALFFKQTFLHDSGSLTQFGGLALGVLGATLGVVVVAWGVLARNIQSGVERLCSVFLPLLGLLVVLFALMIFFLPGATGGFAHYLMPDFSRLGDWTLWRDVFGQVFFSLSLGLGIVTGYSRYNAPQFNLPRSMCMVALGDFVISFISGLAVFGCMGFMSQKSGVAFDQLVRSDSAFEIGFVIFPMILAQFGEFLARFLGPLFFFCVFIAGITGVFSIAESVAGNIEVEFGKSRRVAVALSMGLITLLTVPFCMGNGQHVVAAIAPMVLGNALLIGGIAEIVICLLLTKRFARDEVWSIGGRFPYYALLFFVLPLLLFSLGGALYQEAEGGFSLAMGVRLAWFALALGSGLLLTRRPLAVKS